MTGVGDLWFPTIHYPLPTIHYPPLTPLRPGRIVVRRHDPQPERQNPGGAPVGLGERGRLRGRQRRDRGGLDRVALRGAARRGQDQDRRDTHVQDGTVVHSSTQADIGSHINIGHSVVIHDVRIGDRSLIGNNATVLSQSDIGHHCLVAANAMVRPGHEGAAVLLRRRRAGRGSPAQPGPARAARQRRDARLRRPGTRVPRVRAVGLSASSTQHSPGARPGVDAVLDTTASPAYENVRDTLGQVLRVFERGAVDDRVRVEDHDVGDPGPPRSGPGP